MRIVLVYQHFMVGAAGPSKPYDLACHLARQGHDVVVISGRSSVEATMEVPPRLVAEVEVDGFKLVCLGVKYSQKMGFARRLLAFLAFTLLSILVVCRLRRYDVLLASSTPLTIGLVGLVSRYFRRIPWVFEIRDLWPETPYASGFVKSRALFRAATFMEEWFYREAHKVCAISQRMIDHLVDDRGFPADRFCCIPTGVNLSLYDCPPDREFLARHGCEGKWVAAYVGAHGKVNGLDYLVEAAEHLRDRDDIRLLVIGRGSQTQRLMEDTRQRGLEGKPLIWLPPVPKDQVPGILKACDAALMINRERETMKILMPNKFFDYLASGRPLVVNVRSEVTEWILGRDCGLLSDPFEPADFARVVDQLKNNSEEAERLGRNARRLAEDEFDRAALNRRWEQVLAEAAAAGRRPPSRLRRRRRSA